MSTDKAGAKRCRARRRGIGGGEGWEEGGTEFKKKKPNEKMTFAGHEGWADL